MTAEPAPRGAVTVLPPDGKPAPAPGQVLRPVFQRAPPKPPPEFLQQWWNTRNSIAEIIARERAWILAGKWITDDEKLAMLVMLSIMLGRSENAMLKAYREYQEKRAWLLERVETRKLCAEGCVPVPKMTVGLL